MGLAGRPRHTPRVDTRIDHHRLHEGQGTTSRLMVDDVARVEHATRVAAPAAHVATRPTYGASGSLVADGLPTVEFSPRRWGRRAIGAERVALTSAWAGWRWGPVDMPEHGLSVLPQAAPYDSRAEVPQPDGLVGRHRSQRLGSGTEFEGIRRFATGDRLKRITWPVSLRTGELHVITTRAEQDAGVWLVVDGLRDIGVSGGVDGAASTLDLTMRAAGALAEHHVRTGDRVGLLVVASDGARVRLGSGQRHLQQLQGSLARVRTEARSVAARSAGPRGRCRQRGLRPVADALRAARHRHGRPAAQRRLGRRHRHPRGSCPGRPTGSPCEPRRPDAEDRARRPPRAAGRPRLSRSCRGAVREPSTRCWPSSPGGPGCRG